MAAFAASVALACAPAAYADSVSIAASGTVVGGCTVAMASTFPSANFSASGSITASAALDCNTPFLIRATSADGAAANPAAAAVPLVNRVPYDFGLSVPRDSGGPVSASCTSAAMQANLCSLSSGGIGASNKTATLTTSWSVPDAPAQLIAGSYSDTITLSIAPAP